MNKLGRTQEIHERRLGILQSAPELWHHVWIAQPGNDLGCLCDRGLIEKKSSGWEWPHWLYRRTEKGNEYLAT